MDNEVTNDAYYLLGTCVPTITTTCTVYPSKQGATYVYSLPLPSFTPVLFFFLFQPPPPCVKNANKERKKKAAFHRKLDPVSSSLQPYIVDRYLLGSCVIPPLCSALGLARRRFLGETACARSAVALESCLCKRSLTIYLFPCLGLRRNVCGKERYTTYHRLFQSPAWARRCSLRAGGLSGEVGPLVDISKHLFQMCLGKDWGKKKREGAHLPTSPEFPWMTLPPSMGPLSEEPSPLRGMFAAVF